MGAKKMQLMRDRVALAEACERFANASDNAERAEARGEIERVTVGKLGYRVHAEASAERNEFAALVGELCANRASVSLHGIESAVKHAAARLGIDEPKLPEAILKRLDLLV